MKGEPPPVVPHEREGKPTLWRFTCALCRRRSGSYSLRDVAVDEAARHMKGRCPGVGPWGAT